MVTVPDLLAQLRATSEKDARDGLIRLLRRHGLSTS